MVLLRSLKMARTLLVGSFLSDLMRLGSGTDELNGTPGDILIGADGIHSKVREHVLGPSAPTPTYIGSCTMSGFLPVDSITVPCGFNFPAMIFTPIGLIMAMAILIDPEGKTIAKGREGWREYEVSGEAARVAKAEHADCTTEPIRSLLDNVKDESVRIWAPYEIPELPTWHLGRVCLIGDAAHALPLNGQGSAQALGTQHS